MHFSHCNVWLIGQSGDYPQNFIHLFEIGVHCLAIFLNVVSYHTSSFVNQITLTQLVQFPGAYVGKCDLDARAKPEVILRIRRGRTDEHLVNLLNQLVCIFDCSLLNDFKKFLVHFFKCQSKLNR